MTDPGQGQQADSNGGNGREDTVAQAALEIRDLYVGYYEDLNILQGVNLKAQPARITTILGANGVGK